MKLSDILLVALFVIMGSLVFMMKKMQASEVADSQASNRSTVNIDVSKLSAAQSSPEMAGSYGRLSVEEYLAKNSEDNGVTIHIRKPPSASANLGETLIEP